MSTGANFINRKRDTYIKERANELFEAAISDLIVQDPQEVYRFSTRWVQLPDIIDKLVIKRVTERFEEMNMTLEMSRSNSVSVYGILKNVPPTLKEEYVRKLYWSRAPGKFVSKSTGQEVKLSSSLSIGPAFTGTVREWYETFIETLIDAGNQVHKVMLTAPDHIRVGRDLMCIIECSVLYRPSFNGNEHDPARGMIANRFKVSVDKDLPNNVAKITGVVDGTRFTAEVEVLDMNII